MSKVKCGVIGYGAWGRHHARAFASVSEAELVAICARSEENAIAAAQDHPHARIFRDYREFVEQSGVDLCSVVLPSDLHFPVASSVLASGIHLLLEKPMTLSVGESQQLIEAARSAGRVLAVGHELRHSSLWGRVRELIVEGAIGDPLYALIELWRRPYRLGSGGWRYDIQRVGNWILEEPIHFFDLARWYFSDCGEPVSVFAQANGKQPGHPELHDNFSAIMSFPEGRYAVVTQTLAAWEHHQTVKLTGTQGAIWASWSGAMDRTFEPTFQLKVQTGDDLRVISIDKPSGEVYELVEQAASVVRAVRKGTPVACNGVDGMWSVRMCLSAAESLRTGGAVDISGD